MTFGKVDYWFTWLVQTAINGDNRTDQKEIIPHKMEK